MCVDNCHYVHDSLLPKRRLQKAHLAQTRLSQIPPPLLAYISLQGNIARGEERGLCPGRHFQVQSSTSRVRKASPTSEYASPLGCSLIIPPFFRSWSFFFISFLIKDMQTLLWVTAAAVGVSSHQQEQHWVSVCISALRDCLHVPWQAPRMSPKPRLTSNHFHSRLLRLS